MPVDLSSHPWGRGLLDWPELTVGVRSYATIRELCIAVLPAGVKHSILGGIRIRTVWSGVALFFHLGIYLGFDISESFLHLDQEGVGELRCYFADFIPCD